MNVLFGLGMVVVEGFCLKVGVGFFSYSRVEFVEGVDLIQIGGYGMWVGVGGGWI